jgi:hypothetical protein
VYKYRNNTKLSKPNGKNTFACGRKEETQTFEDELKKRMLFFPEFKEAIIKNKAIIAGGSVLSIFGNYKINDLDIYVNYSNAKELIKDLYQTKKIMKLTSFSIIN